MKDQKQEQEDKSKETLDLLEGHPLTKQIREEREAERLSSRKAAHKALLDLQAKGDKVLPPLLDKRKKAEGHVEEAKARVLEVEQEFLKAKAEFGRVDHGLKVEAEKHRRLLLETYDPELGEAIQWFQDKLAELRKMRTDRETFSQGRNILTMKQKNKTFHNRGSIMRAVSYCQEAVRLLEDMKLLAEHDHEAVEKLKESIPDPMEMEEVESERSFASENDHHPTAGLMSASQADWEVSRLLEKVERVKRQSAGKSKKKAKR